MSAVSKHRERSTKEADPFIEAALVLDRRSVDWSAGMSPENAREFVRRADAYNKFTANDLVRLVDRLNGIIPPMDYGQGNPNTGQPCHRFRIGNESSRVIYVTIIKTYGGMGNIDYLGLAALLKHAGEACKADEAWVVEDTPTEFEFRFWWD